MTDDHHGQTAGMATLLVRAVDGILGTHPLAVAGLPGEPAAQCYVRPGVTIGVDQCFVDSVMPELAGMRWRQRVDVGDQDRRGWIPGLRNTY
jgi:hypothetical protein